VQKPITPDVVVAYRHCPRKAFLLLCTDQQGAPHDYACMVAHRQQANHAIYVDRLKQQHPEVRPYTEIAPRPGHAVLIEATLRTLDLEASCAALVPAARGAARRGHLYEPTIVAGTHTIDHDQRLAVLFAGYVLGQLQKALPGAGTIVSLGGQVHRVPLAKQYARLTPIISVLRSWAGAPAADAPPPILNPHCPQCQFREQCRAQAEHDDDLSLLGRMTPKVRQRYHDRGIFTVQQLSYLYKPRRRGKRTPKAPIQHSPELQALALRTGKIYLHELPDLPRQRTELFLDLEGVPDQRWYYLLGLLIGQDGATTYQPFWADAAADEERIWHELLARLAAYPEAPIYHYGQYERRAITTLARRYETDCGELEQRLVNLATAIHGRVYFPVRSNRLKDIGHFLGVSWTAPDASGLQSLVWRGHWEETGHHDDKQRLLTYNQEDCEALRAVADELARLRETAATEPTIDFAAQPKRYATDIIPSPFDDAVKWEEQDGGARGCGDGRFRWSGRRTIRWRR
jgi:predicted RecB family nuclease